jgi:predicted dehydrogenase
MALKLAVLGFAHGHVNAYCQQWSARPELGITVAAAWDHDTDRLRQTAGSLGIRPEPDLASLLADREIGAVVITAETSLHAGLVEQAAAAGKAIVVQKPLALTLAEADRIVAAVERHRVPFTLAWQMRVDPQNLKIKELISSGELGKVFMVRRRHGLGMCLNPAFADSWHVSPRHNRDIWADDSAHAVDFIHWLLGVPETVTAEIESLHDPRMPNDNGIAIFRYPGGPVAEVVCSFTCPAHENTTEVVCEKGTIIQNYGDAVSTTARPEGAPGLKWYSTEAQRWIESDIATPPAHGKRIAALAEPLAAFLHGKRPPIATAEEGRTTLRMVLAGYVSSREGRRVPLDEESIAAV